MAGGGLALCAVLDALLWAAWGSPRCLHGRLCNRTLVTLASALPREGRQQLALRCLVSVGP